MTYTVTGHGKAADKASLLLSKASTGAKIRKTEWPAWQRTTEGTYWLKRSFMSREDREGPSIGEYETAMGLEFDELDQRAINWNAYAAWCAHDPRDGQCDVCGRGSAHGAVCEDCGRWSADVADQWSQSRAA